MKTHHAKTAIAIAAACLAMAGTAFADADDVDYTTVDTATPGVWNSNFSTSLEYAKANHIPVIMYYGVYGCTYAKKGAQALSVASLKQWLEEKKLIMIYKRVNTSLVNKIVNAKTAAASVDPDLWLARSWVRENSSVATYPIMRIYWNKADGTVVSKTFTCRNGKMPVTTPAGSSIESLAGQLLGSLKKYFDSYDPSSTPAIVTPTEPDDPADEEDEEEATDEPEDEEETTDADDVTVFGTKKLTYQASIINDDDGLVGVMTATASKATNKGVITISGKITDLTGKSRSFSAKTTAAEHAIEKKVSGFGEIDILFTDDSMSGYVGDGTLDSESSIGGTLPASDATFCLTGELPSENNGYTIIADALPVSEPVALSGKKMTTGKAGSVKWVSKEKDFSISETNPSALKLTYTQSTGLFKGSFKVYQYKEKTNSKGVTTGVQLKKTSASVTGFIIDGIGIGKATITGIDTPLEVTIKPDADEAE